VGAKQCRKLLKELRLRTGQRRGKPRIGANPTWAQKKKAKSLYTVKEVRKPLKKAARRVSARGDNGRTQKFLDQEALPERRALSQLIDAGYASIPTSCVRCDGHILAEPSDKNHGRGERLYWRCADWRCQHRQPVTQCTPWPATKMRPSQLARAIREYANYDRLIPPGSDDIALAAGAGKQQVRSVVEFLRSTEASRAKKENQEGKLKGDVEMDGHELAKLHVSPKNKHYKHL